MPAKLPSTGELFIVSAPSGAGKTSLCQGLSRIVPRLKHSVSYTTRLPRKGEIDNIHYSFISKAKFKSMIAKGEFAEWAAVHGNLYGTSIKRLLGLSRKGYDIILDIDINGARQMKKKFKDAVFIFLLPPSIKALEQRLRARMSESPGEIRKRLEKAKDEILNYGHYNFTVINDDFKKALREMESIVISKRLMTHRSVPVWVKKLK